METPDERLARLLDSHIDTAPDDISTLVDKMEFSGDESIAIGKSNRKRKKLTRKQIIILSSCSVLLIIAAALSVYYINAKTGAGGNPGYNGDVSNESNTMSASSEGSNGSKLGDIYVNGTGRFESDPNIQSEDTSEEQQSLDSINIVSLNTGNQYNWDWNGGSNYAKATE